MANSMTWLVFLIGIPAAVLARLVAGNMDRERIRNYVEERGGKVLNISWNPLGPGWYGSRERIYDVRYQTKGGTIKTRVCKTSMYSGVYWTEENPEEEL